MGGKAQDFRDAIRWLEARGWEIDMDRKGYPVARCPRGEHRKTIHFSPDRGSAPPTGSRVAIALNSTHELIQTQGCESGVHEPFGFLDYNRLQLGAGCVLSDSGAEVLGGAAVGGRKGASTCRHG